MRIPAFLRLTYRNIRVNMDLGTMIFMLGLPALYLLVMGTMLQNIIPGVSVSSTRISYTHFLGPGIVAMQTLTAGNIGGGMLWSDRRWGMFEQLLVGPFKRTDYLLGIIMVAIVFAVAGSMIMLGLSVLISGGFVFNLMSVSLTMASLILGTMLFSSLFLIISTLARTMQTYNTITIALFFVLDFASSAFYPIPTTTDEVIRIISLSNPLTYIVDVTRTALIGVPDTTTYVYTLAMLILTVFLFVLARILYRTVRSGV
ncbi:MAG: ABC transporter permease [Candidatus Thermoplasmatota archaeon]|nr:ABC transporter permease [Candidatus Thermoplasmatota archaeon]